MIQTAQKQDEFQATIQTILAKYADGTLSLANDNKALTRKLLERESDETVFDSGFVQLKAQLGYVISNLTGGPFVVGPSSLTVFTIDLRDAKKVRLFSTLFDPTFLFSPNYIYGFLGTLAVDQSPRPLSEFSWLGTIQTFQALSSNAGTATAPTPIANYALVSISGELPVKGARYLHLAFPAGSTDGFSTGGTALYGHTATYQLIT